MGKADSAKYRDQPQNACVDERQKALNPALKRAPSFSGMKEAMETAVGEQTAEQFRKIEYLNIIGNLGPLLGLLGTVLGMIYAFSKVSETGGQANVADLSLGISKALAHTFLGLMLAVAAAMVAHTLRYRSQVITGLAFLLAFSTVTISRVNVYSLSASAILALALVVIVLRLGWFEMEVFGILGTYVNHYLWLRPIIEPMGKHHHPFPGANASTVLLLVYWLIFRGSYILRRPVQPKQERVSTTSALLNTGFLLWVMGYQALHPELAFQFFLGVGAAEFVLGQLPITRQRRTAFVILTTVGATLLVAAFPYKYSGSSLSMWWIVEAEALFLAGVFTSEAVFRRLGMLAGLIVAGQMP